MNTGMAECLMVTMMCIGSINAESQKMFAVGFAKPLDNHEFTGSFLKRYTPRCPCGRTTCTRTGQQACLPCNCKCDCYLCTARSVVICCPVCGCECGVRGESFAHLVSSGGIYYCNPCGCFPAAATVKLRSGKSVTIAELQKGDQVQTVLSSGKVSYNPVTTFLEKQPEIITKYKLIKTSFNKTISLTGNHLIYARIGSADTFYPISADQISIGDEVLFPEGDKLTTTKVVDVSSILMQGAYVPLTKQGNVVVDEILASCYARDAWYTDHDLAHLSMIPMQIFSEQMEWIFGDDHGFLVFVKMARDLGMLLAPDY